MVERDSRKPPPRPRNRVCSLVRPSLSLSFSLFFPLSVSVFFSLSITPSRPFVHSRLPFVPRSLPPSLPIASPSQCAVHPHANRLSNNYRKYTRGRLAALFFSPPPFCPLPRGHTINSLSFADMPRSKYLPGYLELFTRHCSIPFHDLVHPRLRVCTYAL